MTSLRRIKYKLDEKKDEHARKVRQKEDLIEVIDKLEQRQNFCGPDEAKELELKLIDRKERRDKVSDEISILTDEMEGLEKELERSRNSYDEVDYRCLEKEITEDIIEKQDSSINDISNLLDNDRFDVFLSHNSKDKEDVKKIGMELRKRKLKVWLDEWELIPGRPWLNALEQVIGTTDSVVVFVGKAGIGPWEEPEMRACLDQFVKRNMPVIPVLLPGVEKDLELPLFLRIFTWVDLRSGITSQGLDKIKWGITGQN